MRGIFEAVPLVKQSARFWSVGIHDRDVMSPLSTICFILPMSLMTIGDLQVSLVVKMDDTT